MGLHVGIARTVASVLTVLALPPAQGAAGRGAGSPAAARMLVTRPQKPAARYNKNAIFPKADVHSIFIRSFYCSFLLVLHSFI
jgi:hypothetical protein